MLGKFVYFSINTLLLGTWLGVFADTLAAEEPVEAYLVALQDRGYTEVALRYLDRIAESDLVPASFRDELPYRKGEFLVSAARTTQSPTRRQRYLDQAQDVFDHFLKQSPNHPDVVLARGQLGNILVERARTLTSRASQSDDADARRELNRQAFDIYQQAYESLDRSKTEIGEQYKSLVTQRDEEAKAKLQQVKAQYVTSYLMLGRVLFEQAKTVVGDETLYREKLTEAAKAFDDVATKYRSFSAGLYATLYEGECYQRLGEDARALSYFKELLQNNARNPVVRRLKTIALARSIDAWLKTDAEKGPDRSIQLAEEWIKTKRGAEDRSPAWMDFRLSLAKAHLAKSKIAQGDQKAQRAIKAAREIAQDLAKRKSDVQEEAQQLLVAMGKGDEEPVSVADASQVQSFTEARDAAKAAIDAMKLSNTTVAILSSQLKQVRNPARRAEIEKKLDEARDEQLAQARSAVSLFERADALATIDDLTALHSVRYYLSYLYYTAKDYRRAAVIASHTALRYPDSIAAKGCANVALAARQRLYQESPEQERDVQMDGIARIGELMVSKWPEDPAASTALTTLLDVSIARGDVAKAEAYLQRIPSESPKRAVAELRFGQKLWSQYVQQSLANPETSGTGALDELKQRAQALLKQGIEHGQGQAPNESAIRGALTLARIYVDSGQPQDALDLLYDKELGAIVLIEANSSWLTKIPGLSVDGYTTAIRAHIASAADSPDSQTSLNAAEQILGSLRETLSGQPDGQDRMIRIYVSLAQDLQRQLMVASPSTQAALSKGFESFLKRAADGSDDLDVQAWVAQTFYGMATGIVHGDRSSPAAQRYFTEATKAYGLVLQKLADNPQALPAVTVQQIRVRQALALRQTGKYRESIELFAEILAKSRFLNIQVEAAKTLQQWGTVGGNTDALLLAIQGHRRGSDGENLIWGWGRIAKLVSRNKEHRHTFHEARYNIAKCRYDWAQKQSGESQQAALGRARADLVATHKLYGLGNKSQRLKYEKLLKSIQKSLGQPTTGFSKQ